ncbi:aminotransferase class III-fold pyridoxal phosphate-dependent enzyme [Treponema socranskii]|nr:aminotransferase class III-fold pyridoxal phosphate-dependent enzyme [Treponema socranskii]
MEKRCLEKGLCVSTAGANVIRFLPPLTITDEEMDAGLAIFRSVLKEYV